MKRASPCALTARRCGRMQTLIIAKTKNALAPCLPGPRGESKQDKICTLHTLILTPYRCAPTADAEEAGAPEDEIEITSEIVEAGGELLRSYNKEYDGAGEDIVAAIYAAMHALCPPSTSEMFGGGGGKSAGAFMIAFPAPPPEPGENWKAWRLRLLEDKARAIQNLDGEREIMSPPSTILVLRTNQGRGSQ